MKILLVGGSDHLRIGVMNALRGSGHSSYTSVARARIALQTLKSASFDLIICDWDLPDMPGMRFLREVRQTMGMSKAMQPFVLVATYGSDVEIAEAMASEVSNVLLPPISMELVDEVLKEYDPRDSADSSESRGDRRVSAKHANILLIHETDAVRMALERALGTAGIETSTACNDGREASVLLAQRSFDMVISDVRVPKGSGLDLLRQVRQEQKLGSDKLPFILLSEAADKEFVIEAAKLGVTDYIVKPFTGALIREKLAQFFQ